MQREFNKLIGCLNIGIIKKGDFGNNKSYYRINANITQLEILRLCSAQQDIILNIIPILNHRNIFEIFPNFPK